MREMQGRASTAAPGAMQPPERQTPPVSHREYLILSLPLILSALSTPLLGAVDTAVVGRLPEASYIGGVAVGTLIFNTLYWLLGFLRVSTSGFAAQAHGAQDRSEVLMSFLRPVLLALGFGVLFLLLQKPILQGALALTDPSAAVREQAALYYEIRIWGAPFLLLNYCVVGWLMGVSEVRKALYLQLFLNGLNIALCLLFALVWQGGVAGVAAATLCAEVATGLLGLMNLLRSPHFRAAAWTFRDVIAWHPFLKMLKVNRDLFLRTVCLLTVFTLFTAQGDDMGAEALAANAILLQIQFLLAYAFDGFANASGILVGRAKGKRDSALYDRAVRLSVLWGFAASLLLSAVVWLAGKPLIAVFTSLAEVQAAAHAYLLWLVFFPVAAFWGLLLNGIFSGATEATPVRNSMMLSLLVYLAAVWLLVPRWENHGLWLAFLLFTLGRSLFLWMYLPRLRRTVLQKP